MKNLLNRITNSLTYRGIKKGLEVPTLPDNINKVYNHVFVRIFRVIGGVCFLLVLSQKYTIFPNFLHWIIIIIGLMQSLQMFIIFSIKSVYSIYTLISKPHVFEVRNSPLNEFATIFGRILYCAKFGCVVGGSAATILGGGAAFDEVLVNSGRPPKFMPFMGSLYNSVFGEMDPTIKAKLAAMSTESKLSVTEDSKATVSQIIGLYEKMNDDEKKDFIAKIKGEAKKENK